MIKKVDYQTNNVINKTLNEIDGISSFTQLLVYKGNLTETELKTENAKTIRLR